MNLCEAFRALDALNEDTFSISDDGIAKLAAFQKENDAVEPLQIIDPEAETEDDIADSYVGKVILDCCVCHSKIYKNKEEIKLDEEQTLANIGEECPFCYTSDGFKIVGEVAAFGGNDEVDPSDDEVEDVDDTEEIIEEAYEDTDGIMGGDKGQKYSDVDLKAYWEKEKDNDPVLKNYNGDFNSWHKDTTSQMKKVNEGLFGKRRDKGPSNKGSDTSNAEGYVILVTKRSGRRAGTWTYTATSPTNDISLLNSTAESQNRKSNDYRYQVVSHEEAIDIVGRPFDYSKDVSWHKFFESVNEGIFGKKKTAEKPTTQKQARKWQVYDCWDKLVVGEYDTRPEAEDSAASRGHDGRYKVQMSESIKESVNNVNVETDEDFINISTDSNGGVTVTTEPKADEIATEDEVIVPVTPETQDDIINGAKEVDADIEEFDEESFDALGEAYLKKVYENVESYKSVNVSEVNNSIVVEGLIKFNTGVEKKTSFILEAKDCTKSGKYRFSGSNKQITEGKKGYIVSGRVLEGKFISESFNYNYRSIVEGVSKRVYGIIKS